MKYIDEYRSPELVSGLLQKIEKRATGLVKPITIMEVCGSHTTAIGRYGIRQLLPDNIRLVSGPGCPVCVTSIEDIDQALWLAAQPEIIFASYGDLLRVPGSHGNSLEKIRAAGAQIKTVHSALDAVALAQAHPEQKIVFMGIGFETTSPTVAAAVLQAKKLEITNFFIFCSHKLMPPVMRLLLADEELKIDGFLCPGHVSTIIGAQAYNFIIKTDRAAVITGFEPVDILEGISLILEELTNGVTEVKIQYQRGVKEEGNPKARTIMNEVFQPATVNWRGLGEIPESGLVLREKFAAFDAQRHFSVPEIRSQTNHACRCGEVLRGLIEPSECNLFGTVCTPASPFGPCMVSNEGCCAAFFRYPQN
ncbi:MAG: hydrogenase formation protein HypD [Deltaproteobacteria bacterium]|nr:hydrogenase formation protein HypD [Candidatus Tharpella aukensis]